MREMANVEIKWKIEEIFKLESDKSELEENLSES